MRISSPNVRPKAARIAPRDGWSDRNVSEKRSRGCRGQEPVTKSAWLLALRFFLIGRKRQNIRRAFLAAVRAIPARNFGVRDEANGDGFGGQAKHTAGAREEFSEVLDGNADIALAIHDHESRCCGRVVRIPAEPICRAGFRASRDVIANPIARYLPRAFFAERALGLERAAGACLCAARCALAASSCFACALAPMAAAADCGGFEVLGAVFAGTREASGAACCGRFSPCLTSLVAGRLSRQGRLLFPWASSFPFLLFSSALP